MLKVKNILFFATSAIVLATGCTGQTETVQNEKVIPVKTLTVSASATTSERNYVGTVEASSAVSVSFSGMGTVERVLVSEGERVRKGQLLAVLNSSTAQNAYDVAKSTLHQAQDAYDRLKPLHEKGSLTDIKLI